MNTAIRSGAPVALLVLATACGNMTLPTAPTSTSRIYVSVQLGSRFVLHDDGTFALQYSGVDIEDRGTYKEANDVITFDWGCCGWVATGSLRNDSLSIRYSDNMLHSDFHDGVYIRAR